VSAPGPWERHARQWSRIGPPLRPSAEDARVVAAAIDEWRRAAGRRDPTILLLGVTPELCGIDARVGRVIATDHSLDMIRGVWPGRVRTRDAALAADWRALPIAAGSIDVALADGSLTNLPFPSGYAAVGSELRRTLAEGGLWIVRCFVQAGTPESVADVLSGLAAGEAGGFHAFKWRLAMALQVDARAGVALGDVWNALAAAEPDLDALAHRGGWTIESVRTIEAYRGLATRYSFPSLAELRAVIAEAGFSILEVVTPGYELGDRCPTIVAAAARDRGPA
jgi:hypothetical protein